MTSSTHRHLASVDGPTEAVEHPPNHYLTVVDDGAHRVYTLRQETADGSKPAPCRPEYGAAPGDPAACWIVDQMRDHWEWMQLDDLPPGTWWVSYEDRSSWTPDYGYEHDAGLVVEPLDVPDQPAPTVVHLPEPAP